jgi:2-polyprenyl-3-methyl-5-hydroxy-6-metoxy-1,4-benzoquinol methylase
MRESMDRESWESRYQGEEFLWTDLPNRFLVAETEALEPGRALDVACGEGRNAVWLAARGWRVTGVDFSAKALEKAQSLAERRGVEVDWVCADLREYQPPLQAFELVVVLYLQLAAEMRETIFSRVASAVAPGGTFLLVAHDASNLERGYGGPRNSAVLYDADEVVSSLDGFEIERAGTVVRPVETPDGRREAIDVLVRAGRTRR